MIIAIFIDSISVSVLTEATTLYMYMYSVFIVWNNNNISYKTNTVSL